jgi:hypothetical protein
MISAPHIQIIVAEIDFELIGSGYARIEEIFESSELCLFDLCTQLLITGKGVNAKIIEALKSGAFFRMYSK